MVHIDPFSSDRSCKSLRTRASGLVVGSLEDWSCDPFAGQPGASDSTFLCLCFSPDNGLLLIKGKRERDSSGVEGSHTQTSRRPGRGPLGVEGALGRGGDSGQENHICSARRHGRLAPAGKSAAPSLRPSLCSKDLLSWQESETLRRQLRCTAREKTRVPSPAGRSPQRVARRRGSLRAVPWSLRGLRSA